ncbi:hypothetical protein MnTg02_00315 [bacterium MnTg02]|nr:hypothetical protein MnTg02_00315 [bacterium MnTg02]
MATQKKRSVSRLKAFEAQVYDQARENASNHSGTSDTNNDFGGYPFDDSALQFATALDAVHYIEAMTSELRDIADRSRLAFLAYLLDIAAQEAKAQGELALDSKFSSQS